MWGTEGHPEHEGITGVTFDSDGHRLVGTLYLARGEEPKPTALLLHGCPGLEKNLDLAATLRDRGWNALLFHYRGCWGSAGRYDLRTIPRDVTAAVGYLAGCRRPLGWIPAGSRWWGTAWAVGRPSSPPPPSPGCGRSRVYGAAARLDGPLTLSPAQVELEFTRFLATTPHGVRRAARRGGGADQPAGRGDRHLAAAAADRARHRRPVGAGGAGPRAAGPGRAWLRYIEVDGANHAFAWHRAQLRVLIADWLDEVGDPAQMQRDVIRGP